MARDLLDMHRAKTPRQREIGAAMVYCMDVDADGGTLPAEIEPMTHADFAWTPAAEETFLRWFRRTAPGSFS